MVTEIQPTEWIRQQAFAPLNLSDGPDLGKPMPKSNAAQRKLREQKHKHYLKEKVRLNAGTEFRTQTAIKWIRHPSFRGEESTNSVIEGALLSKVGNVMMYPEDFKERVVMKNAVIVRPQSASSARHRQKPIAEAVEISSIVSKNPPLLWSDLGKPKPKLNAAQRKLRERKDKHYLKEKVRLNKGTELQSQTAIKWIRHPSFRVEELTNSIIEGALLSKVGDVLTYPERLKKRIVMKNTVIVRPQSASSGGNRQQPIAEAVEISSIVSENPPLVWSDATLTRETLKTAERIAIHRSSVHYVEQAKKLNRFKYFKVFSATWIVQLPMGEQKVTSPQFLKGTVISEPGTVEIYGQRNVIVEGAVIVKHHKDTNRSVVEPVQTGRICFEEPKEVYSKKSIALQLTGSCCGYVLVKFDSSKEIWWVPEEDIKELAMRTPRRKIKKINYCEHDLRDLSTENDFAKPNVDSGGCLAELQCSPVKKSDNVLKPQHIPLLNNVFDTALAELTTDHQNNGVLPTPAATTAAVESLDPKDKPKLHKNTSELVQVSLFYQAVRTTNFKISEFSTFLGMHANGENHLHEGSKYLVGIQDWLRETARKKQPSSSKSKMERKKCQAERCSANAHSASNFRFCWKHSKHKKCRSCKKNVSRRKDCLCGTCWKKSQRCVFNKDTLCVRCSQFGRANKAIKQGGLCEYCIKDNIPLRNVKPCADCGKNRYQRQGGICESCYKKRRSVRRSK